MLIMPAEDVHHAGWHDARLTHDRILQLLSRGHSLALATEKWLRTGLWVVTRSDVAYPWRLKQRLKTESPPALFGAGDMGLLNAGGLAVVGSRNASGVDLSYATQLGGKAASSGIPVVSGGARGVGAGVRATSMNWMWPACCRQSLRLLHNPRTMQTRTKPRQISFRCCPAFPGGGFEVVRGRSNRHGHERCSRCGSP